MNKSCEICAAIHISEKEKEEIFKMFFGKRIECPIDDIKITCIYSKMSVNWDYMLSELKKYERR